MIEKARQNPKKRRNKAISQADIKHQAMLQPEFRRGIAKAPDFKGRKRVKIESNDFMRK